MTTDLKEDGALRVTFGEEEIATALATADADWIIGEIIPKLDLMAQKDPVKTGYAVAALARHPNEDVRYELGQILDVLAHLHVPLETTIDIFLKDSLSYIRHEIPLILPHLRSAGYDVVPLINRLITEIHGADTEPAIKTDGAMINRNVDLELEQEAIEILLANAMPGLWAQGVDILPIVSFVSNTSSALARTQFVASLGKMAPLMDTDAEERERIASIDYDYTAENFRTPSSVSTQRIAELLARGPRKAEDADTQKELEQARQALIPALG